MIKLVKDLELNTVSFYPDAVITGSADGVTFLYQQDYNNATGEFDGVITSQKEWVIVKVSGSDLPTPNGHYTVTGYSSKIGEDLVWSTSEYLFEDVFSNWEVANDRQLFDLIHTERAFILGIAGDTIISQYTDNDKIVYKTYEG